MRSFVKSNDGFRLSEDDLEIRGPGEVFGYKQSGFCDFKFVDLINDDNILINARNDAFEIIMKDPCLENKDNLVLKNSIYKEYQTNLKQLLDA